MNVLHLHISDSASFPIILSSQPNVTYYGAYSENELYTAEELKGNHIIIIVKVIIKYILHYYYNYYFFLIYNII